MVTIILVGVIIYLLAAGGEKGWYNRKSTDGFGRLNKKFNSRGKYSEFGYGMSQENQYNGQNPYGSSESNYTQNPNPMPFGQTNQMNLPGQGSNSPFPPTGQSNDIFGEDDFIKPSSPYPNPNAPQSRFPHK